VKVETPIFHPQPSHNWHPVDDVPIHHGCCVHSGPIHPLSLAFFITTLLLYYLPNPNQPNPTQPTNHCMRALVMSELVGKMRSWDLKLLCILRNQTRAWDLKFQCIWDLKRDFETCICYVFEISNKLLRSEVVTHLRSQTRSWDLKLLLVEEGWYVG
jgi:hypothetical protein